MAKLIKPVAKVTLYHVRKYPWTDGRDYKFGVAATFQVTPDDWRAQNTEIWLRPKDSEGDPDSYIATCARKYPSADMNLADWISESGSWEAASVRRPGTGPKFLIARKSDGSTSSIVSGFNWNLTSTFALTFIASAPATGTGAKVEVELANVFKFVIGTHGFDPMESYTYANGYALERHKSAFQEVLRSGSSNEPVQFAIAFTMIEDALYYQKFGEEIRLLARNNLFWSKPTGKLRVRFIGCSGAFHGGDMSWVEGTMLPRNGIVYGGVWNPATRFWRVTDEPSGTVVAIQDATYTDPQGRVWHTPQLTLTPSSVRTPTVKAVSVLSDNKVGPLDSTSLEVTNRGAPDNSNGWVVFARYTLRKKGSDAEIHIEYPAGTDYPETTTWFRYNAPIKLAFDWDTDAGDGSPQDEFEMFITDSEPEKEVRDDGSVLYTVHAASWALTRLQTKRSEALPGILNQNWKDWLTYVLVNRHNVPSSLLDITDDGFVVRGHHLADLNINDDMDGPALLDEVVEKLRPGWFWYEGWPAHKIVIAPGPRTLPATKLTLDQSNTDELDHIKRLDRSHDAKGFVTNAWVRGVDSFGRPRQGLWVRDELIRDSVNVPYVGHHQTEVWESQADIDAGGAALVLARWNEDSFELEWEGKNRPGLFPDDVIQVDNVANTDIPAGTKFEITERTGEITEFDATLTVLGRQVF